MTIATDNATAFATTDRDTHADQTRANAEHILTAAQTRAARVLPTLAELGQGCDTEAGK